MRHGHVLRAERNVDPPEGVAGHAGVGGRGGEARRLEEDAHTGAEVMHKAGRVVDQVDGGGVGVDAHEGALVQAAPHLEEEERSGEEHTFGARGGRSVMNGKCRVLAEVTFLQEFSFKRALFVTRSVECIGIAKAREQFS